MAKVQKESLIGQVFGYLTILSVSQLSNNKTKTQKKVIARCICGVEKEYFLCNLRKKNHTTSCGCHKIATAGDAVRTHGLSRRNALYTVYHGIKRRCYNENAEDYAKYGANGVRMCDLWRDDYKPFHDWCIANGWKKGMQIDKDLISKQLGIAPLLYSPETCTILTQIENSNARKDNILIEYNGEYKTLAQWARQYGVRYHMVWERLFKLKWDIHKAIHTPRRKL